MPLILDSPTPSPPLKPFSNGALTPPLSSKSSDLASPTLRSPQSPSARDAKALRRHEHHEADIVIIGAGIIGCAAAVAFSNQGRSVILLERSLKEPDRIVGELLQPGGVRALRELGLGDCLEGIDAVVCKGYEVRYYGEGVRIPYPPEAGAGGEPLEEKGERKGAEGRSFHHGRFVGKLRKAAMRAENVMVVESTVNELVTDDYSGQVLGVKCTTHGEEDYYFASLTLACDGYASKFRKTHHRKNPQTRSKFFGLELHDCILPLPNHGLVSLSAAPPVLLYQIGTHETRCLVDIPEGLPSASPSAGGVKNHLRNVVLPSLPACVQPSFEEALNKGQLRSMPNSFLPASTNTTPGFAILGDALNMRHPLTGGGMTVAFKDVLLLSSLLSPSAIPDLTSTPDVLATFRTFHWRRKNQTAVINILAMALYSLFAANDSTLALLQRGCFHYFGLGGACVTGPVSLLGGLVSNPLVLVYHFFSVAAYAIWVEMAEGFSRRKLNSSATEVVPGSERKTVGAWVGGMLWAIGWFLLGGPVWVLIRAAVVIGEFIVAECRS